VIIQRIQAYFEQVLWQRGLEDAIRGNGVNLPPLFMPRLRICYSRGYECGAIRRNQK
jgi:hypothetical protein